MAVRKIDLTKLSPKTEILQKVFARKIVAQDEAVQAFGNVTEKYLSGFYDRTRPIGTMLFLGPTGTGKTSSVEAYVEGIFGKADMMIKIDCGEFQHSHDIAKLVGSPPGYLGHRETSPLFTNARIQSTRTPEMAFTVLLFDEIEKSSDSLWNLLLGVLDTGIITTGTNEVVDLKSTVIVMTSNVGSKEMSDKAGEGVLGFLTPTFTKGNAAQLKSVAVAAARRKFTPEFLNRIDETIMFNTLTQDDIAKIFWLEMKNVNDMILVHGSTTLSIDPAPAAVAEVLRNGYDKRYNARNLKREIERKITRPVARAVSTGQASFGDRIVVDFKDGEWSYYAVGNVRAESQKDYLPSWRDRLTSGMAGSAGVATPGMDSNPII